MLSEKLQKKKHKREGFSYGNEELDTYLLRWASQSQKRNLAQVYVLPKGAEDGTVIGYYTLSALHLESTSMSEQQRKRFKVPPDFKVPSIIIGRFAVDQRYQGQGIGRQLLTEAFKQAVISAETIGVNLVLIDAIDEAAKQFYLRLNIGLEPLPDHPMRLILPMQTLQRLYPFQ